MVVKGVRMDTAMRIHGSTSVGIRRQAVAVGAGAAVAVSGAYIGVIGALGAFMGCHDIVVTVLGSSWRSGDLRSWVVRLS
jgi:hypothetical protein